MVIPPESRMGKYRDDDRREDAPHFRNRHIFCMGVFYFEKLEMIQLLILGISKFWLNSQGIRFWNLPIFKFAIFGNAWLELICVGVSISNHPICWPYNNLRWSFWYIKLAVLIWIRLNPHNFDPRNFQFFNSFSFKNPGIQPINDRTESWKNHKSYLLHSDRHWSFL